MFINDIDGGVEDLGGFMSKFADDSKWAREVMGEVYSEQWTVSSSSRGLAS